MAHRAGSLYEAIGGMDACRRLSEKFHDRIAADPVLRAMFPQNMLVVSDRLALFLAEQLGGPADYTARRGKNSLLCRHAHLPIGPDEVTGWVQHMAAAMVDAGLPDDARKKLHEYFAQTALGLSDPFIHLYDLPLDELRARLEQDPALASAEGQGRTLLKHAALRWDLERVRLLLEYGADLSCRDRLGHHALSLAAGAVHPGREQEGCAVVALLLQHGAEVNGRSGVGRMTPLHNSARRGTVVVGELLLAAGADIEARDSKGETPLRRAVNCGQSAMVRMLLAHGAEPAAVDDRGKTALESARTDTIRQALLAAAAGRVAASSG